VPLPCRHPTGRRARRTVGLIHEACRGPCAGRSPSGLWALISRLPGHCGFDLYSSGRVWASSMVHRGRLLSPALVVKLAVRNLCDAERGRVCRAARMLLQGMANRAVTRPSTGTGAEVAAPVPWTGRRAVSRRRPVNGEDSWPISGWSPSPQRSRRATYAVVRTSSLSLLTRRFTALNGKGLSVGVCPVWPRVGGRRYP
jgi:hypothetical protein